MLPRRAPPCLKVKNIYVTARHKLLLDMEFRELDYFYVVGLNRGSRCGWHHSIPSYWGYFTQPRGRELLRTSPAGALGSSQRSATPSNSKNPQVTAKITHLRDAPFSH